MLPTITAGIISYNEENLIEACINGALKVADYIVISDGLMNGTKVDKNQRSDICTGSTDNTRKIIDKWVSCYPNKIKKIYLDGLQIPEEKDLRNIQYFYSKSDYFLIIDADEVWDDQAAMKLKSSISDFFDSYSISNRLFFGYPTHFLKTKHWRLFRADQDRFFCGNNEMTDMVHESFIDCNFFHYGYINKNKVKEKMDLYSGSHYSGCGPWWYQNVFIPFLNGTSVEDLLKINGDTLHPWGSIDRGFAKDEWGKLFIDKTIKHPPLVII